jgi:peptide deformylase
MTAVPKIILLGNPLLRLRSEEVDLASSKEIQSLAQELLAITKAVDGVGISAPQIGKNIRLSIIASNPNRRYPNAPYMRPTVVINPKIILRSKTRSKDWEGCLSVPGIRALVPRYDEIKVEYINLKGKLVQSKFSGFIARVFQHEYDHLEGLVFLDRVEDNKEIVSETEYYKIINNSDKP